MLTIATVCARGGSTGLPGKNIRPLQGKPLIAHTIGQARACPGIDGVYVSTDDPAIAEAALMAGAIVPYVRPAHLATATAAKIPVIIDLVDELERQGIMITRIVDLDPTSPLRDLSDITACLSLLDDDTDCVITAYPAEKNPYFNMVERDKAGSVHLSKTIAGHPIVSRQQAPDVFAMNASIYVWHRHSLGAGLWQGRTRLHVMPRERSIDVDSLLDFKMVEMLMDKRANG